MSKTQKRQLSGWIQAGPEVCGYPTGCWTSVLIQDLIYKKFHVLYNRFYVCELLHNLGFSHQKARFVSDHLDEEARQRWMKEKWPEILAQARQIRAPIFFGDETSFALWGSLAYTWAPIGQQPQVKTTGLRKGYKVFGVIEFFSGRLIYQGLEERFNSASYQGYSMRYVVPFVFKSPEIFPGTGGEAPEALPGKRSNSVIRISVEWEGASDIPFFFS